MAESASDIRKKLMELQNELLKGVIEKGDPAPPSQVENTQPKPIISQEPVLSDDGNIAGLLREMCQNQRRIISILTEIKNKVVK
ncbi:MAG: hypothetical protein Q8920_09800 [Bacillota bacterium]|nr:hypothetical protein [Bacillota bacterium]